MADYIITFRKWNADAEFADPVTAGGERFERNFALFRKKWPESPANRLINFVCVNAGNYCGRGAEYVNTLFDMVMRNLSQYEGDLRLWCVTDDPESLPEPVQAIPPMQFPGWPVPGRKPPEPTQAIPPASAIKRNMRCWLAVVPARLPGALTSIYRARPCQTHTISGMPWTEYGPAAAM
jgi:hypothetical protein